MVLPGMGGSRLQDLTKVNDGTFDQMDASNWVGETHAGGWGSLDFTSADSERVRAGKWSITGYPFTVMLWVKVKSFADWRLMQIGNNAFNSQYLTFNSVPAVGFRYFVRFDNTSTLIQGGVQDTEWHLLTGVSVSATDHLFYVDKDLIGTDADAQTFRTTFNHVTIGGEDESAGTAYSDCFISEFRIYNRAFSQSEIASSKFLRLR